MGISSARQLQILTFQDEFVGVMVGFEPLKNLFIEVGGLYGPLHLTDENLISIPEEGVRPGQKLTVIRTSLLSTRARAQ